jgi:hypothetical protein
MGFNLTQIINKVLNVKITDASIQVPVDIQNVSQNIPVTVQNAPVGAVNFNVYNNVSILNTSVYNMSSGSIVTTGFGNKVIEIYNTLNQPVTINFIRNADQPYQYYDKASSSWKTCSIVVPAGSASVPTIAMITRDTWPLLGEPLGEPSNVTAQCTTAPTSGSVIFKLHTNPVAT